jgi:hypothetical protein
MAFAIAFCDPQSSNENTAGTCTIPADRMGVSATLLAHGAAGLGWTGGRIERVVVKLVPTFDDLVAASLLLDPPAAPAAWARVAEYAALMREGHAPGSVPVGERLDAFFAAMLAPVTDLTQASQSRPFLDAWEQLWSLLKTAVADGRNVFLEAIIPAHELQRQRTFLRHDIAVYQQDLTAGRRWTVTLPGGRAGTASLLRDPRSILFRHWSRYGDGSPDAITDLLLLVVRDGRHWIISTDPVQRLDISSLAARLQSGEPPGEPWFAGDRFAGSLIASPKAGTAQGESRVLAAFRRWGKARPIAEQKRSRAAIALVALVLVGLLSLGGMGFGVYSYRQSHPLLKSRDVAGDPSPDPGPGHPSQSDVQAKDGVPSYVQVPGTAWIKSAHPQCFAVLVSVAHNFTYLNKPGTDAARVYRMLRDEFGYPPDHMQLLTDQPELAVDADGHTRLPVDSTEPSVAELGNALGRIRSLILDFNNKEHKGQRPLTQFVFFFSGHGVDYGPSSRNYVEPRGYLALAGFSSYLDQHGTTSWPDTVGMDMDELSRQLRNKVGASHELLLLDCCHSGYAVSARGPSPFLDPGHIFKLWREQAHCVIAAAAKGEEAQEDGAGGLFTSTLIEGLTPNAQGNLNADVGGGDADAGNQPDGIVTQEELATYIRTHVPPRADAVGRHQHPQAFDFLATDDVGQFLFVPDPPSRSSTSSSTGNPTPGNPPNP